MSVRVKRRRLNVLYATLAYYSVKNSSSSPRGSLQGGLLGGGRVDFPPHSLGEAVIVCGEPVPPPRTTTWPGACFRRRGACPPHYVYVCVKGRTKFPFTDSGVGEDLCSPCKNINGDIHFYIFRCKFVYIS